MIFTESQKKAIHHGDSNLQLIACAGSGNKLWIITEADRSVTTLLIPGEY